MDRYFKRNVDDFLLKWKEDSDKKVLQISGGRQIGKTESIRHFAENYQNVIWIDAALSSAKQRAEKILCSDLKPMVEYIREFANVYNISYTDDENTLLVIDEIQESKMLYECIRRFNRELGCDVIVTGSYLGQAAKFFQPAGDMKIYDMYTMSFSEFLDACGKGEQYHSIDMSDTTAQQWYKQAFESYLHVGGYPSVVKAFLADKDYTEALSDVYRVVHGEVRARIPDMADKVIFDNIMRSIIQTALREKKGDRRLITELSKLTEEFDSMRIRTEMCYNAIAWLLQAKLIGYCDKYNLQTGSVEAGQRFYFTDVGLLSFLMERYSLNEDNARGYVNENFVYRLLMTGCAERFYTDRPAFVINGSDEVDFYVKSRADGGRYVIEVKSSDNKGISAARLLEQNKADYLVYFRGTGGYGKNGNVITVPLPFAEKFNFDAGGRKERYIPTFKDLMQDSSEDDSIASNKIASLNNF